MEAHPARELSPAGGGSKALSERISELYESWFDRRPERVEVEPAGSVVCAFVFGSGTQLDRSLVAGGQERLVERERAEIRAFLEQPLRDAGEQALGRPVSRIIGSTDLEQDLELLVFALGSPRASD